MWVSTFSKTLSVENLPASSNVRTITCVSTEYVLFSVSSYEKVPKNINLSLNIKIFSLKKKNTFVVNNKSAASSRF
jgi:hypothetical protein